MLTSPEGRKLFSFFIKFKG